jgi:hypothetical protein
MVSLMISMENNAIAFKLLMQLPDHMTSLLTSTVHPTVLNSVVTEWLTLENNAITDVTTLTCQTDADPTASAQNVVMVSLILVRSVTMVQLMPTVQTPVDSTVLFPSAVTDGSISVSNVMMETERRVMGVTQCAVTSVVMDSLSKMRSAITELRMPMSQTSAEPTADSQFVVMVSLITLKIVMMVQETPTQHQMLADWIAVNHIVVMVLSIGLWERSVTSERTTMTPQSMDAPSSVFLTTADKDVTTLQLIGQPLNQEIQLHTHTKDLSHILHVLRDMNTCCLPQFNHCLTSNTNHSLVLHTVSLELDLFNPSTEEPSLDLAFHHHHLAEMDGLKLVRNAILDWISTPTGKQTDAEPTVLFLVVVMVLLIVVRNVMTDNGMSSILSMLKDATHLAVSSQDGPTHMLSSHGNTTPLASGLTNHLLGQCVLLTELVLLNHQSTSILLGNHSSSMVHLFLSGPEDGTHLPTRLFTPSVVSHLQLITPLPMSLMTTENPTS